MKKKIKINDHEYYDGEVRDGDIAHGQGILVNEKLKTKHEGSFEDGYPHGLAEVHMVDKAGKEIKLTGIWDKDKGGPDYGFYELPNGELYQGELKNLNYHGKGKYRHSSGMIVEGIYENGEIKKLIKEYHFRDFAEKYLKLFVKETQPKLKNDREWVFVNHPSNEYQKIIREDYFVKDFISEIIQNNCENLLTTLKELNIEYDYKLNINQTTNIQKVTFKDGSKYYGEMKNDKKHGLGTLIFANGDKFVGQWKDDKMHGQGTLILLNGDEKVGEWKNGELIK